MPAPDRCLGVVKNAGGCSVTAMMRPNVSPLGAERPLSIRDTACFVTFKSSANGSICSPRASRASRIRSGITRGRFRLSEENRSSIAAALYAPSFLALSSSAWAIWSFRRSFAPASGTVDPTGTSTPRLATSSRTCGAGRALQMAALPGRHRSRATSAPARPQDLQPARARGGMHRQGQGACVL